MFTIGTDPEFFVLDENGKAVPSYKFFPGKAEKAKVGEEYSPQILAFRDGYAAELNVPANHCRESLTLAVMFGLRGMRRMLPKNYTLTSSPAVAISLPDDIKDAPEDCRIFGCDPSWNAYTQDYLSVPLDATEHPFRYAGGHMHISVPSYYRGNKSVPTFQWIFRPEDVMLFVKMLDLYVGLPLTIWFAKEATFRRRQYYGKAGEFRFQEYGKLPNGDPASIGVEYRTPGPEVWNAPPVASFAFGAMRQVANLFDVLKPTWEPEIEQDIRNAVNTGEGAYLLLRSLTNFYDNEFLRRTVLRDQPFQMLMDCRADQALAARGWTYYTNTISSKSAYALA